MYLQRNILFADLNMNDLNRFKFLKRFESRNMSYFPLDIWEEILLRSRFVDLKAILSSTRLFCTLFRCSSRIRKYFALFASKEPLSIECGFGYTAITLLNDSHRIECYIHVPCSHQREWERVEVCHADSGLPFMQTCRTIHFHHGGLLMVTMAGKAYFGTLPYRSYIKYKLFSPIYVQALNLTGIVQGIIHSESKMILRDIQGSIFVCDVQTLDIIDWNYGPYIYIQASYEAQKWQTLSKGFPLRICCRSLNRLNAVAVDTQNNIFTTVSCVESKWTPIDYSALYKDISCISCIPDTDDVLFVSSSDQRLVQHSLRSNCIRASLTVPKTVCDLKTLRYGLGVCHCKYQNNTVSFDSDFRSVWTHKTVQTSLGFFLDQKSQVWVWNMDQKRFELIKLKIS
jgi:hypothetical protein